MTKKKSGKLAVNHASKHPKVGAAKTTSAIRGMSKGRKAGSIGNTYGKLPAKHGRTTGNV